MTTPSTSPTPAEQRPHPPKPARRPRIARDDLVRLLIAVTQLLIALVD